MEKKGTPASPAMALASSVLPVPAARVVGRRAGWRRGSAAGAEVGWGPEQTARIEPLRQRLDDGRDVQAAAAGHSESDWRGSGHAAHNCSVRRRSPGGPTSSTPLGMRAPTAVKRSGFFRNSTICGSGAGRVSSVVGLRGGAGFLACHGGQHFGVLGRKASARTEGKCCGGRVLSRVGTPPAWLRRSSMAGVAPPQHAATREATAEGCRHSARGRAHLRLSARGPSGGAGARASVLRAPAGASSPPGSPAWPRPHPPRQQRLCLCWAPSAARGGVQME